MPEHGCLRLTLWLKSRLPNWLPRKIKQLNASQAELVTPDQPDRPDSRYRRASVPAQRLSLTAVDDAAAGCSVDVAPGLIRTASWDALLRWDEPGSRRGSAHDMLEALLGISRGWTVGWICAWSVPGPARARGRRRGSRDSCRAAAQPVDPFRGGSWTELSACPGGAARAGRRAHAAERNFCKPLCRRPRRHSGGDAGALPDAGGRKLGLSRRAGCPRGQLSLSMSDSCYMVSSATLSG